MAQLATKLQQYLAENMNVEACENDTNLLEEGLVDSMGILELAGFIEQEWSVEMEATDMVMENFETIDAMIAFIQSKLESA